MGDRARAMVESLLDQKQTKQTQGSTFRTGEPDKAVELLPALLQQVLLDGNARTYDVSHYIQLIPNDVKWPVEYDEMPGLQIIEKQGAGSVIWLVDGTVIHYPHEKSPQVDLKRIDFDAGHVSRFYNVSHKVLSSWPDDPGDYINGEQGFGSDAKGYD